MPDPSLPALFARALTVRCPQCGSRGLFEHWLRSRTVCPSCGIKLDRGEGDYYIGGNMMNIAVAFLLFALVFVGIIIATRPHPPWHILQWVLPIGMLVTPFITYRLSKTIWLAFDLAFRPAQERDFDR